MPITELHRRKRTRNIAVFAAVAAFMLTVFFVTIIRLKGAG
jgi:hypothetical protein